MNGGGEHSLVGRLGPVRGRQRFMLTPLVDVVFLLLIFFMLSSSIAPYSLLTIAGGRAARPSEVQAAQAPPPAVMTVARGVVRAGDIQIDIGELPEAIAALKKAGLRNVVLLTTRAATVQDLASALEAFQAAGVESVRLVGLPGQRPPAN